MKRQTPDEAIASARRMERLFCGQARGYKVRLKNCHNLMLEAIAHCETCQGLARDDTLRCMRCQAFIRALDLDAIPKCIRCGSDLLGDVASVDLTASIARHGESREIVVVQHCISCARAAISVKESADAPK